MVETSPASRPQRAPSTARPPGRRAGLAGVMALIRRYRLAPYLLLLPSVAAIVLVLLWPVVQVALYSFQNYGLPQTDGAAPTQWVGLSNYATTFTDPEFWLALRITVLFAAACGDAHPAHRDADRPAAEPARPGDVRRGQYRSAAGLADPTGLRHASCSTRCSTRMARLGTVAWPGCRTGRWAHRLGRLQPDDQRSAARLHGGHAAAVWQAFPFVAVATLPALRRCLPTGPRRPGWTAPGPAGLW